MLLPFVSSLFVGAAWAQYSATYLPDTAPETSEEGQTGTNKCGDGFNQTSNCQNAYLNGLDDFCLWAPPEPGPDSVVGNTERIEVSWCIKEGYGTRLIPNGAIKGAHFVKTPNFVQITGVGDLTLLNIPAGDAGGELDPHGADGNGNPIGGLVFSSAFGELQQIHEWTNFMSADQFCFRACNPAGEDPPAWCQHIYDVMGCAWNMPANYAADVFESCDGESGAEPMGVYGGSTFHQGEGATPAPHDAPSSSNCKTSSTIGNTFSISGTRVVTSVSATTTRTGSSPSTTTGSRGTNAADVTGASNTDASDSALALSDNLDSIVLAMGTTLVFSMLGAVMII